MRLTEEQKGKLIAARSNLLRRMRELVAARSKIFTQFGNEMVAYPLVRAHGQLGSELLSCQPYSRSVCANGT